MQHLKDNSPVKYEYYFFLNPNYTSLAIGLNMRDDFYYFIQTRGISSTIFSFKLMNKICFFVNSQSFTCLNSFPLSFILGKKIHQSELLKNMSQAGDWRHFLAHSSLVPNTDIENNLVLFASTKAKTIVKPIFWMNIHLVNLPDS